VRCEWLPGGMAEAAMWKPECRLRPQRRSACSDGRCEPALRGGIGHSTALTQALCPKPMYYPCSLRRK